MNEDKSRPGNGRIQGGELLDTIHQLEMREMFGWFSHELAQPLAAMGAYVGAAQRFLGEGSPPKAKSALEQGLGQIDRARTTMSESRAGFVGPVFARFEVLPSLSEVLSALNVAPASLSVGPNMPRYITSSRADVQAIVYHLVRNAREAQETTLAPGHGVASPVRVHADGSARGDLTVDVTNASLQSVAPQWFEAFHTSKSGHLGIGLTVARRLSENLMASLDAAPASAGEVCLRLELPERA